MRRGFQNTDLPRPAPSRAGSDGFRQPCWTAPSAPGEERCGEDQESHAISQGLRPSRDNRRLGSSDRRKEEFHCEADGDEANQAERPHSECLRRHITTRGHPRQGCNWEDQERYTQTGKLPAGGRQAVIGRAHLDGLGYDGVRVHPDEPSWWACFCVHARRDDVQLGHGFVPSMSWLRRLARAS